MIMNLAKLLCTELEEWVCHLLWLPQSFCSKSANILLDARKKQKNMKTIKFWGDKSSRENGTGENLYLEFLFTSAFNSFSFTLLTPLFIQKIFGLS